LLRALPDLEHGGGEDGEDAKGQAERPQIDVGDGGDADAGEEDEKRELDLVRGRDGVHVEVDQQRDRHYGELGDLAVG